jgi:putative DNA primase/helicase
MNVARIAKALGGEVVSSNSVLAPGLGHSRRDRSLSTLLDPTAPDGFIVHSHAEDHWLRCRDYVRERLDLPPWEPGDEQSRTIPKEHVSKWDLASPEAEAVEGTWAWTKDELHRVASYLPAGEAFQRTPRDGFVNLYEAAP